MDEECPPSTYHLPLQNNSQTKTLFPPIRPDGQAHAVLGGAGRPPRPSTKLPNHIAHLQTTKYSQRVNSRGAFPAFVLTTVSTRWARRCRPAPRLSTKLQKIKLLQIKNLVRAQPPSQNKTPQSAPDKRSLKTTLPNNKTTQKQNYQKKNSPTTKPSTKKIPNNKTPQQETSPQPTSPTTNSQARSALTHAGKLMLPLMPHAPPNLLTTLDVMMVASKATT